MIFKQDDIYWCESVDEIQDTSVVKINRLHKPSGVFFNLIVQQNDRKPIFFEVGSLTSNVGQFDDRKTFETNSKGFYAAVDLFEELISKRIPQDEPDEPNLGTFLFYASSKHNSTVMTALIDEPVELTPDEVSKAFLPPKTKKYGKLDIFELQDSKFDEIRAKYACNFNKDKTQELEDLMNKLNIKIYAYDLIPYETMPPPPGGDVDPPPGVNDNPDDKLNPKDVEGENPDDLTGEPPTPGGSDPGSDEPGTDEPGTDEPGTDEPGTDEPGTDEPGGDEPGTDEPGGDEPGGDEPGGDEPGGDEPGTDEPDGDEPDEEEIIDVDQDDLDRILSEVMNVSTISNFNSAELLISQLRAWSPNELKTTLYPRLGVDSNVPVNTFLRELKERTKIYFE